MASADRTGPTSKRIDFRLASSWAEPYALSFVTYYRGLLTWLTVISRLASTWRGCALPTGPISILSDARDCLGRHHGIGCLHSIYEGRSCIVSTRGAAFLRRSCRAHLRSVDTGGGVSSTFRRYRSINTDRTQPRRESFHASSRNE